MNKKIFALLLMIFVLISMSAASAEDINDNNATLALDSSVVPAVVSDDSNALGISNDDEIQSESNAGSDILAADTGSLSGLKQDINIGGSATLNKNYQYTDGDAAYIAINQDTTIDGAGHTIDLGGKPHCLL